MPDLVLGEKPPLSLQPPPRCCHLAHPCTESISAMVQSLAIDTMSSELKTSMQRAQNYVRGTLLTQLDPSFIPHTLSYFHTSNYV